MNKAHNTQVGTGALGGREAREQKIFDCENEDGME